MNKRMKIFNLRTANENEKDRHVENWATCTRKD